MLTGMIKVLSAGDMDKLHDAALTVLQNAGLRIHGRFLLEALREHGCKVDFDDMRAWFDPALVEKQIAGQKGRCKQARSSLWYPFCKETPGDGVAYADDFCVDYGYAVPTVLDMETHILRPASRNDQMELIKLGNAIPEVKAINSNVIPHELPPAIEVIESAGDLILNTPKPGWVGAYDAVQARYLAEFAQLFTNHDAQTLKTAPPFFVNAYCTTSPLKIDDRTCNVLEEAMKHGFPVNFCTMPILGATTPVTVAGSVVVGAAELLGAITAATLINPDVYYYQTCIASELDMRTMNPCYATPSAVLTDAAMHQLFKFKYGLVTNVEPHYVEGNAPSIQTTFVKMYRLMTLAQTASMPLSIGLLANGSVFSGVQAMIDLDFAKAMHRFSRGVEVNDGTMAVDLIQEMLFCDRDSYLTADMTLDNYAELLWQSEILDRGAPHLNGEALNFHASDEKLIKRAYEKYHALLSGAPEYEAPAHIRTETAKIIAAARREILGG